MTIVKSFRQRLNLPFVIFTMVIILLLIILLKNHSSSYATSSNSVINRCTSSHRKHFVAFNEDDVINPQFSYPINVENACTERPVEVLIPVHSAITNFLRRARTRKNRQGKFSRNKINNGHMIFFVGLPSDKLEDPSEFQRLLNEESERHGDIVQINLDDAYKNIAYKAIAVLQWINTYCNETQFVIKMDDDIVVNPEFLVSGLYKLRNHYSEFIVGELRTERKPEFTRDVKWRLQPEEYSESTFPPFVPGPVYAYPTSTGRLLYQQALRTKTLWLDDVFITGICTKILGIPVLHDENFSHVHKPMKTVNFIFQ